MGEERLYGRRKVEQNTPFALSAPLFRPTLTTTSILHFISGSGEAGAGFGGGYRRLSLP